MEEMVSNNNTLIVIEHNLDIIAQADWIIDIGPGAGKYGGRILFSGHVSDLLDDRISITGEYLRRHIPRAQMLE